ncbi:MAG: CheB methylesterase [Polaromonas sp.]|nr:CheB methylesterase [Polaromonas sp.]
MSTNLLGRRERNIVVVGGSAGGLQALEQLVSHLPADLDAAIFVVLHIPSHTPTELDKIVARNTPLQVSLAQDKQAVESGRIYIAPTDRHLMLQDGLLRITRGPKEGRSRPSIDVLFRSAAENFGPRAVGVVLSGMLDDGTAGLWAIKDRRGMALVQSPEEALHSSMPQSSISHVKVDMVAPVKELAKEVITLSKQTVSDQALPAGSKQHFVENRISMEGNGLRLGVMKLGAVSKYTCPDCHGVLVQIEEGSIVRFRCHTGHAFSLQTLLAEVNGSIDKGLWDTLRAVEERIMLLRQMAGLAETAGRKEAAAQWEAQADEADERVEVLRELVLDGRFLGHFPEA